MRKLQVVAMMVVGAFLGGACSDKPEVCPDKDARALKYRACPGGDSCEEGTACWNGFCAQMCDLDAEGVCAGARETCVRPYESAAIGVCLETCLGAAASSSEYLDNDFASCSLGGEAEHAGGYWGYDFAGVCGS